MTFILQDCIISFMNKITVTVAKPRNLVVKNDRNRAARHRDRTQYQRHHKHRKQNYNG